MKKSGKKGIMGFFIFTKGKFAIAANVLIFSIILHNVVSVMIKSEEQVFYTISLIAFAYFILAAIYSAYIDVIKK